MELTLYTDPERRDYEETGIYVRALDGGTWRSVDIVTLTSSSLLAWLRSRGGENEFAESTLGALLGHDDILGSPPPKGNM